MSNNDDFNWSDVVKMYNQVQGQAAVRRALSDEVTAEWSAEVEESFTPIRPVDTSAYSLYRMTGIYALPSWLSHYAWVLTQRVTSDMLTRPDRPGHADAVALSGPAQVGV